MSDATAAGITLLDGSVGHALRDRVEFDERLWSTTALREAPDAVRRLHVEYVRAGADVITTNSYGVTPLRLRAAGLDGALEDLAGLAGRLAVEARAETGRDVRVAGSLPPLRGSYRPDRVADEAEIVPVYTRLAEALAPHVDLLLCETMSTAGEARAAATAATTTGLPTWVAWTLSDTHPGVLRSGESIEQATGAVADLDVSALLVNCTTPASVSAAIPRLAGLADVPVGGYPNTFADIPDDVTPTTTDRVSTGPGIGPDDLVDLAGAWIADGAGVVGGCCGIGPDHIAALSDRLAARDPA